MMKINPELVTICDEYGAGSISPFACTSCKKSFTWFDYDLSLNKSVTIFCHCGHPNRAWHPGVVTAVIPSCAEMIDSELDKMVFYHATANPEWDILDHDGLAVHLGTVDAALDRAEVVFEENEEIDEMYLFTCTVVGKVSPHVHPDFDDSADSTVSYLHHISDGCDVARYINAHESIGSISVIADKKVVMVHQREILYRDDFQN